MSVVTQLPTMCNPDAVSGEQLKEEYLRLQGEVFLLGDKLHNMNLIAHSQAAQMHELVDAFEAANEPELTRLLQSLSDRRKVALAQGQTKVSRH